MSVYNVTGQVQPARLRERARTKSNAALWQAVWLWWEETPVASKVRRISMLVVAGFEVGVLERVGAKVVRRRLEIWVGDQVAESWRLLG